MTNIEGMVGFWWTPHISPQNWQETGPNSSSTFPILLKTQNTNEIHLSLRHIFMEKNINMWARVPSIEDKARNKIRDVNNLPLCIHVSDNQIIAD